MPDNHDMKPHTPHHAVQFYGNKDSLFTTVAGFLSEGLVAEQPTIVIATEDHRLAILERLRERFIDVDLAQRCGDLVLIDAEEMLGKFMSDEVPDPSLFEDHVGGLIDQSLAGRPRTVVRAYGEMVDVLWQKGRSDAAIRLEMLWNKLALSRGFALLCGYSMGNFYKKAEQFQAVCDLHTHVMTSEPNVAILDSKRRTRSA
ncbi:MAG: hypothetical protein EHM89_09845 [Acidobacteria bacterium]|jgi:MEDS: MEthanogen/methylotroph, DcmR Sensory domain|nr:MAG: hypothetical protein EHM89_09845 [Acidobacteriota bacterium]